VQAARSDKRISVAFGFRFALFYMETALDAAVFGFRKL
jgi:hypothetical protein